MVTLAVPPWAHFQVFLFLIYKAREIIATASRVVLKIE